MRLTKVMKVEPMKYWAVMMILCLGSELAHASSLDTLADFLKNTRSAHAEFAQVVTSPAKTGQISRVKKTTGTFDFVRPAKFRFDYKKPFEQMIVADGQTLWLYDVDLQQVTARKQAQSLSNTPAALIATATDLRTLEKDFLLQSQEESQGVQWVLATPKTHDGSLQSVRIGLRQTGNVTSLAQLEIVDAMGQKSVLQFDRFDGNTNIAASTFEFTPPKGVDVIRP
jgi:outer membrane lipoprotein carrier protein